MTSKVTYEGGLRTKAAHIASQNSIITDAPVDNRGKGEAFSPTDLTATALASCMLTIMGITATDRGWNIDGSEATVIKSMGAAPRRIAAVEIVITMKGDDLSQDARDILEKAGRSCPVALSLHPDIEQKISFVW